jgi:hypothetical protein
MRAKVSTRLCWQLRRLLRREIKGGGLGVEEPSRTVERPLLQSPGPKLRNCNQHYRPPFPVSQSHRKVSHHVRLPPLSPLLYSPVAHRSLLDNQERVGATREGRPVRRKGKYPLHRISHLFQNPSLLLPLDVSQSTEHPIELPCFHRSRVLSPNLACVTH